MIKTWEWSPPWVLVLTFRQMLCNWSFHLDLRQSCRKLCLVPFCSSGILETTYRNNTVYIIHAVYLSFNQQNNYISAWVSKSCQFLNLNNWRFKEAHLNQERQTYNRWERCILYEHISLAWHTRDSTMLQNVLDESNPSTNSFRFKVPSLFRSFVRKKLATLNFFIRIQLMNLCRQLGNSKLLRVLNCQANNWNNSNNLTINELRNMTSTIHYTSLRPRLCGARAVSVSLLCMQSSCVLNWCRNHSCLRVAWWPHVPMGSMYPQIVQTH